MNQASQVAICMIANTATNLLAEPACATGVKCATAIDQ